MDFFGELLRSFEVFLRELDHLVFSNGHRSHRTTVQVGKFGLDDHSFRRSRVLIAPMTFSSLIIRI